jgi:hypothetical protein
VYTPSRLAPKTRRQREEEKRLDWLKREAQKSEGAAERRAARVAELEKKIKEKMSNNMASAFKNFNLNSNRSNK